MPVHPCTSTIADVASGNELGYGLAETEDEARLRAILMATEKMIDKVNANLALHACSPPCELHHEIRQRVLSNVTAQTVPTAPAGLDPTMFAPDTLYRAEAIITWSLDISCRTPTPSGGAGRRAFQPRRE